MATIGLLGRKRPATKHALRIGGENGEQLNGEEKGSFRYNEWR